MVAACGAVRADLLPTDPNAMALWQGTQLFTKTQTIPGIGTFTAKAEIDFAVYAPGQFDLSAALGLPAALDPSNGTEYVYAYEVHNDPTANVPLAQFSVGITKYNVPTNSDHIGQDPSTTDGGQPPDTQRFNPVPGDPTSALWFFTSTNLIPGSSSDILFFTSPYGPTMHTSSVLGSVTATANLPSPAPEPGTIALAGIGFVCLLAARRFRRRSAQGAPESRPSRDAIKRPLTHSVASLSGASVLVRGVNQVWAFGGPWRGWSCASLRCLTVPAHAINASNVLVLYNADSANGLQIADYYAQVHPGVQLLGINGITTLPGDQEAISADNYLSEIRPQVQAGLTSSINTIVTTMGMPLRVELDPTTQAEPTGWPLPTYVDGNGVQRSILNWNSTSSLESELTNINAISTWQMMGDQSYSINGFSKNSYFGQTTSFDHATQGTYLTSRLDGYTVSDAINSINNAQHAWIGPNNSPNGPAYFLIDNDPSKTYATSMSNLANNVSHAGLPLVYDDTSAFVNTAPGPVIMYDSHGGNQASTPPDYIANLNVTLAPGAVFNSWESYNAQSFLPGGNHGNQGLIADWLAKGGTAGTGNVAEPGASTVDVTNEDHMVQMLLSGKTFAEAAWSSIYQLSYVNTVVGDPLMTWKQLIPGDVNCDGVVDISDLALMGANWGHQVGSNGYGWQSGDLNGDGVVDISDLAILGADWGQSSSWASYSANTEGITTASLAALYQYSISIPEPSSITLAVLGASGLFIVALRRRMRNAQRDLSRRRTFGERAQAIFWS